MASYGTAATWAETMGLKDIKNILHQTLEEEEKADQVLSVAADTVNVLAYNETMDTEDEEARGFFGVGEMQAGNI
jgi:ferritin-like metal-binding protein YciE